jgi:hypothetical protein
MRLNARQDENVPELEAGRGQNRRSVEAGSSLTLLPQSGTVFHRKCREHTVNDYAADADTKKWVVPLWVCSSRQYVCSNIKREARNRQKRFMSIWMGRPRKLLRRNKIQSEKRHSEEWGLPIRLCRAGELLRTNLRLLR